MQGILPLPSRNLYLEVRLNYKQINGIERQFSFLMNHCRQTTKRSDGPCQLCCNKYAEKFYLYRLTHLCLIKGSKAEKAARQKRRQGKERQQMPNECKTDYFSGVLWKKYSIITYLLEIEYNFGLRFYFIHLIYFNFL